MPEKDILEDLLLPDPEPAPADPAVNQEEVQALKAQLLESEKAQQGLLKNVQDERRKRQELKGQMNQVTTTVNSLLEQREQIADTRAQAERDADTLQGIPVEFTEAGDGYIPTDKLQEFASPNDEKIAALEEELAATKEAQAAQVSYQQGVDAMVGQKPEYDAANRQYQTARKWISDVVADWSYNNNVNRPLNSKEALTHVINDQVEEAFEKEFPGMDIFTITTADDTDKHFKRMLDHVVKVNTDIEPAPKDSRFRRVLDKPSSLGKSADGKGGELSLADKVASLSATEILSMDDATLNALENHLKQSEEKDGIDWQGR